MIEISVRLLHGAVFFVGEELQCWVTLRNVDDVDGNAEPSDTKSKPKEEYVNGTTNHVEGSSIAFLTGQIHCQCIVEETKVNITARPEPKEGNNEINGRKSSVSSSNDQNSFCVVSTFPKGLIDTENISLHPGEEFSVIYSEIIPSCSSPSFRGSTLKYSWKLAFGCQVMGQSTTVIHIPLWIMVIQNLDSLLSVHENIKWSEIQETTVLAEEEYANGDGPREDHSEITNGHSPLPPATPKLSNDVAMQLLDNLTSRRTPRTYSIDSPQGKLGKLSLPKTKFRLGEDIYGNFDFSDRSVSCVEYLVSLVGEESVHEPYRRSKSSITTETSVSKAHDFCLCVQQTNFVLPIPLHVTSTFSSDLVDFRWKLRFEFALSPEMLQLEVPSVGNDQQSVLWRPPLVVPVETFTWDIPVEIFPTDPVQVHGVHLRDSLGSDVKVRV